MSTTRLIRGCVAAGSAIAFVLLSAAPAQALTKVREPLPTLDDLLLPGFCEFDVIANDIAGGQTQTLVFDDDGNLLRIDIRGHLVSQLTNAETGESVTVNNSGPVTIFPQDDGSLRVVQTGQSVAGDMGLITGDAFLVHHTGRIASIFVPNPQTGFVDAVSQTRTGHTTDLCAALSP